MPPAKKAVPSLSSLGNKSTPDEKGVEQNPSVGEGVKIVPINKTPGELAAETPAETAERYNLKLDIPDEVANNPRIPVDKDSRPFQIPGATHLHPDVHSDIRSRNISPPSEQAQVTKTVTSTVYADEDPNDDKGMKNEKRSNEGDENDAVFDGVEHTYADENKNDDKGLKDKNEGENK